MLIVGAKGFASEIIDIVELSNEEIAFFDIDENLPDTIFGKYPILKSDTEVQEFFSRIGTRYTLGVGRPSLRAKLREELNAMGGELVSTISNHSVVGEKNVTIGQGSNILANAIFSNNSSIGKACIVYYNVVITHDVRVGDYVELSPGATLLGNCSVGDKTHIGANATILPHVKIGNNCIIGAGAVVTRDIPDNSVAVGIPARITQ